MRQPSRALRQVPHPARTPLLPRLLPLPDRAELQSATLGPTLPLSHLLPSPPHHGRPRINPPSPNYTPQSPRRSNDSGAPRSGYEDLPPSRAHMMLSGPPYQTQAKMSMIPGKLADDEAVPSRAHHHRPCLVTMASDAKQPRRTHTCSLYTRTLHSGEPLHLHKGLALCEGV